jgi:hypothetical protein
MNLTIPLQMIDLQEDGYHPLIEVSIFGETFKLVLDTGASKTAFDQTMISSINPDIPLLSSDRLSTGLGTSTMASFTTRVTDLYFNDFLIPEFEAAVLDLSTINIAYEQLNHPQILGVLGGDILMQYKAVIDYGNRCLLLHIE